VKLDFNGNAIGVSPKAGPFQDLGSTSKQYTFWDDANFPTLPSLPAAPSNFSVTTISSTEKELAWTNNATNATHMVIKRQKDGGAWVIWGFVNTMQTSVRDDQLSAGSTYNYQIAARNAAGWSAFVSPGVPEVVFPDVPPEHWAFLEIGACSEAGIVAGYPDGSYRPSDPVTRDQMAVYISRALVGGEDNVPAGPDTPTFGDVLSDDWAYRHIEYCFAQGVVEGYSEEEYRPDLAVTRDQMAVYIARAIATPTGEAGLIGYDPPETPTFPDVPETFWCYKHVEYCVEHGVVQGYEDGLYRPERVVTRDQMAVYVARAFEL
jgi:hypothetical protein